MDSAQFAASTNIKRVELGSLRASWGDGAQTVIPLQGQGGSNNYVESEI